MDTAKHLAVTPGALFKLAPGVGQRIEEETQGKDAAVEERRLANEKVMRLQCAKKEKSMEGSGAMEGTFLKKKKKYILQLSRVHYVQMREKERKRGVFGIQATICQG